MLEIGDNASFSGNLECGCRITTIFYVVNQSLPTRFEIKSLLQFIDIEKCNGEHNK